MKGDDRTGVHEYLAGWGEGTEYWMDREDGLEAGGQDWKMKRFGEKLLNIECGKEIEC